MAGKNSKSPLEYLLGFEANIEQSAYLPEGAISYEVALSDNAAKIAEKAGLIAVLTMQAETAYQYKQTHDGEHLSPALSPVEFQELYVQLSKLRQSMNILGGVNKFVQMAADGTFTLPNPNVQFETISAVISQEIADSPGFDPHNSATIVHSMGFNWGIDPAFTGTDLTIPNPKQPGQDGYNPNWPYVFLAPFDNSNNRLTDLWEIQYLVQPAKGPKGDQGDPGQIGPVGPQGPAGECNCTDGTGSGGGSTGPTPPGPAGGGTDGTGSGGGVWSGSGVGDQSVCGEPVQIYYKDLIGLRSFIFAPAQLLPTDFDYPNVNLRSAIDQVGANTFPNYDPARLKSATLLLDMAYLVSETVPTPIKFGQFQDITYTPDNTLPRLYSDTTRTNLLGQWPAGTTTGITIPFLYNGVEHNAGITAGVNDFTSLTIDLSGQKPVYIDGSVVPLPNIAAALDDILNGRTGARIFVSCLTYDNTPCTDLPALPDNTYSYFFVGDSVSFPTAPSVNDWFYGSYGTEEAHSIKTADFYDHMERRRVVGFEAGKTYKMEIMGQKHNGVSASWSIMTSDDLDTIIATSNEVPNYPSYDYNVYDMDFGNITMPAGVVKCGVYYVIFRTYESCQQFTIYEV